MNASTYNQKILEILLYSQYSQGIHVPRRTVGYECVLMLRMLMLSPYFFMIFPSLCLLTHILMLFLIFCIPVVFLISLRRHCTVLLHGIYCSTGQKMYFILEVTFPHRLVQICYYSYNVIVVLHLITVHFMSIQDLVEYSIKILVQIPFPVYLTQAYFLWERKYFQITGILLRSQEIYYTFRGRLFTHSKKNAKNKKQMQVTIQFVLKKLLYYFTKQKFYGTNKKIFSPSFGMVR